MNKQLEISLSQLKTSIDDGYDNPTKVVDPVWLTLQLYRIEAILRKLAEK